MKARRVNLLGPEPKLTPKQRAQRKYRASAKGKAASARAFQKWYAKPENRAAACERARNWSKDNRTKKRVYQRVWKRVKGMSSSVTA